MKKKESIAKSLIYTYITSTVFFITVLFTRAYAAEIEHWTEETLTALCIASSITNIILSAALFIYFCENQAFNG